MSEEEREVEAMLCDDGLDGWEDTVLGASVLMVSVTMCLVTATEHTP